MDGSSDLAPVAYTATDLIAREHRDSFFWLPVRLKRRQYQSVQAVTHGADPNERQSEPNEDTCASHKLALQGI
jgi:hypothetical protein